jgi:proteasome component ECM29
VFAVLALIQRDPSFGIGDTYSLRFLYKPPIAEINETKIKVLIPNLFLAKFEPSPPIKELMKQLWTTMIINEGLQKLVPLLQSEIISYLCLSLSSRQWRDREAACSALEGFLPLRPWEVVRKRGEDLWLAGMSVLDDVRDSTRLSAIGFMKVLSDQVLRACNPEESGSSSASIDDAIG